MVKAVLLVSRASALFGVMLLLGCAHQARELPPDMSNLGLSLRLLPGDTARPEYAISCMDLRMDLAKTREELSRIEAQLRDAQAENQSKGIVGILLFTPIMLSMEDNEPMKNRHHELDEHRERLLRISQARQCSM